LRQAVRAKRTDGPLRRALTDVFGHRLLGESSSRRVIPAYSLDEDDVYLFKTPHHPRFHRDGRETMVDMALTTTAAPTYFPTARLRHHRLVDGGVWANNPVLVGVVEALTVLDAAPEDRAILSLGTTDPVRRAGPRLDRGGLVQWARAAPQLLLRAQALSSLHMAEHLLGKQRVTRIDPVVPDGMFELDRLDPASSRSRCPSHASANSRTVTGAALGAAGGSHSLRRISDRRSDSQSSASILVSNVSG
jgi:patatin-like phospholipase/acyl hydrolase